MHLVTPGGSIQAAIDKAGPGDTVFVAPGVYHENVLLEKDGLNLVGFGAHLRPPAQNALSPCADPNHPEETIGICIFGPFFAGALTSDVGWPASRSAASRSGLPPSEPTTRRSPGTGPWTTR